MQEDSRKVFERHIKDAINFFPNLEIKVQGNDKYLKGILDINGCGAYLIEIRYKEGYPKRYPYLLEVGGEIPCEFDYHKYKDNTCCLTVDADEILKCINGITIIDFIKEIVIPFFANQLVKKNEGKFIKEYSHGKQGIFEFYSELLKTSNLNEIKIIGLSFLYGMINKNDNCICGSGKKTSECHLDSFLKLQQIGKHQVKYDLKLIS
ncbi:MAG: hypothetical protein PHO86_05530 [Bacilli bacterium]|nr:hypothetical protein [Bacilli bacterium]